MPEFYQVQILWYYKLPNYVWHGDVSHSSIMELHLESVKKKQTNLVNR